MMVVSIPSWEEVCGVGEGILRGRRLLSELGGRLIWFRVFGLREEGES